jgi:hypothetical protein
VTRKPNGRLDTTRLQVLLDRQRFIAIRVEAAGLSKTKVNTVSSYEHDRRALAMSRNKEIL